ncbi:LuxR C-terminal-related transcriptional regulator [Enterobacter sp. CC120223-11]|uniref:helix-turn-helix transcriptional regulator n=1 Tax=Enterobacter sp. CC120223-11 TaxID=1378073 RepID=UPI000BCCF515|nr:LuxR C-terminal-related transcriptional regulator [Enterobacter sp. CC120223-11]SNY70183.1 Response regulator containing a CheY-like receiver domain and an HTH DNA-binding domain [Enterobacter sp. CC120223-11]
MDSVSSKCDTGRILVISSDKYFYMGMRSILTSMLPDILQKNGVVYDIESVNISQFIDLHTILSEDNIVVIIDYHAKMELNSNVISLIMNYGKSNFKLIIFEPTIKPVASHAYFSKKMRMNLLKEKIFTMITQTNYADFRKPFIEELTPREGRLINHVLMGRSIYAIAEIMGINIKSVYAIRASAYKKFGVTSLQGLYHSSFRKFYITGRKV